jgi:ATP-binding cassette, subfamily B, bacterial
MITPRMSGLLVSCARLLAIAWRQSRGKTVGAVVLMLSGNAAAPAGAMALRWMTNAAIAGRPGVAAVTGAVVAALAVAALTFGVFAHVLYFELSELSVLEMEQQLIGAANGSARMAHHERPAFADVLSVARQDIQQFRVGLEALLTVAGLAVAGTLTAVFLAQINPLLLVLLPLAVAPLIAGRRAEQIVDRARLATAERRRVALGLFRLTTDPASGKELRVSRLRDELLRRHDAMWTEVTRQLWRAHLRSSVVRAGGQLVFAACYLGAVLLVVREAVAGRRTAGDVLLSVALAALVSQQVASAVTLSQDLHRMSSTLSRLRGIHEAVTPATHRPPDQHVPARLARGIELVDVSFTYPDTEAPVLCGVNLTLPAGATVAIVGENGAGKTSLIKLLCGFYEPTTGRILIDGVDLSRLSLTQWRARIAAGFQDFARFEMSARQTVGVGDLPQIDSDEAVRGALHRARATSLLDQLEDGLDTHVGNSYAEGTELSGGQWQKVALGRAFMREQPLLQVLDEPSTALDAQAEHALFERYAQQARRSASGTGAITLLVSHRFSTVRMADLIVVVADQRVVQAGDHATLIREGGLYADLYRIQALAYA